MNGEQSDPRTYLKTLWRWKALFLAFLIGVPLVAYLVTSREQKVYQSSVLVQEDALPVDSSLFSAEGAPAPSSQPSGETLSGEARVIETPAVARIAARHMTPRGAPLRGSITATANTETGFITITANAPSAQGAAALANAYGAAVVQLRTQQAVGLITHAIDQVQAQLGQLRGGGRVEHDQLSAQLQRLRALRAAQGTNAQILQPAISSSTPVSPKVARAVELGLLAGLLLGIGAVVVAQAADRRVRHPEELEELTGLPLLAAVPSGAFSDKAVAQHDEAFHMLRSALTYFNVDRPLSSVLISSPFKGDGKTTVATRLAMAAAQAGRDVILVDADLRRPQAASRLHVTGEAVRAGHGLTAVLSGQTSLPEALVDVPFAGAGESNGKPRAGYIEGGRLRLLPAGGTPPNPSELLASQRMRELLSELEGIAELVVVDTNPVLSVSDSLPLFSLASGSLMVARLNATDRDAIIRLQKTVANAGGQVLGVVATGVPERGAYSYYGYGYANGNGGGHLRVRLGRLPSRLGRLARPGQVKQPS